MEKKIFSRVKDPSFPAKKSRQETEGVLRIYGIHPVVAALHSPSLVNKIVLQKDLVSESLSKIRKLALKQGIMIQDASKQEFLHLFPNENHQGVGALLREQALYKDLSILEKGSLVLILDHLEDPQNFGAILRTCEQMGVDGVVIPKHRSVGITPGVLKVSSGAAFSVPIIQHSSLIFVLEKLKSWGYWIYGTDIQSSQSLSSMEWSSKVALVMGNESRGISDAIRKQSDFLVSIPSRPSKVVDSLNVSVATGIFLYEILRSRNSRG